MKILLDTHAFLYLSQDAALLGRRAWKLIRRRPAEVYLSVCSIWEMAIKTKLGRLELDVPLERAVEAGIGSGLRLLDLRKEAIYRTMTLDMTHRDPFDRILAAQALVEEMTIISKDAAFDAWGVVRAW